jgi:ABC-type sugar transport system ATPase subunit
MSAGSAVSEGPILVCDGLCKAYGPTKALRGISLEIEAGQIVALFGDNGAGKSTLVRIICGAEQPDEGRILLGGAPVALKGTNDGRRRGIEVLWQELALARALDATGNLFLGRELVRRGPLPHILRPLRKAGMAKESARLFRSLDLDERLYRGKVAQLSGGQRQQLAFARTTIWAQRLVLMDEPTAALSVPQRQKVWEWCRRVAERGTSVIAVGHSIDELLGVADRVIVLRQGRKVLDEPSTAVSVSTVVEHMAGLTEAALAERLGDRQDQ